MSEEEAAPSGGGVLVPRWTSLRIPAGGLRLSIGPDGGFQADPLVVEVTMDMWPHWLEIAIRHWRRSQAAHADLLAAHEAGDSDAVHAALSTEFQESMQAISSSAFALDALLGAISEQWPPPQSIREAWSRNSTPRTGRLLEMARRTSRLTNEEVRSIKTGIRSVFRFRDWAVHPPRDFRQPHLHPDLNVGVDWRFAAYTAQNATLAVSVCIEVLMLVFGNVREGDPQRIEWGRTQNALLERLLGDLDVKVHRREGVEAGQQNVSEKP